MAEWLRPEAVFDGRALRQVAVAVEDGRIAALEDRPGAPMQGVLTPGFVDLQVNGGGGTLLNTDPTAEGIARIAAAHRAFGTTTILPTVITDAPEVLDRACAAVRASDAVGLHIEGPHIAAAKRGTHATRHIRALDGRTLALVQGLRAAGKAVLITLAPEAATPEQIAQLDQMGAVVSLGHSNATADEARVALRAGARCFTHLFNAMSPMTSRAAGMVGAAINSEAYVGIIADGLHVADEMVALAVRARPKPGRMMLVSDAMPTVGGPDRFALYGHEIRLQDGRLINAEGNLAGAHSTMLWGVTRLTQHVGLPLETALQMAVTAPSQLIFGAPPRVLGASVDDLIVLRGGQAQPFSASTAPAK